MRAENPFLEILNEVKGLRKLIELQSNVQGSTDDEARNQILTVKLASEFLHIAPSTVYRLVNTSQIPFMKKTGRLYFDRGELISWLKEGRQLTQKELDHLVDDAVITNNKKEK